MEIRGPFPFRAVAAYQPAGPAQPKSGAPTVPSLHPNASTSSMVGAKGMDRLVAGRVTGGMDFDSATVRPVTRHTFQMYTNATDRIEAATGVARGRFIDVRG